MASFLIEENIRRYRLLLAGALKPGQREMVEKLLAEDEAKLQHDCEGDSLTNHRRERP